MGCDTYTVLVNDVAVAKEMSIDYAVILVKALFIQFSDDYKMKITLHKDTSLPCKAIDEGDKF